MQHLYGVYAVEQTTGCGIKKTSGLGGEAGGRKGLKRIKAPLREEDERMRYY